MTAHEEAAVRLFSDAALLNDPAWTAELHRLVREWFARPARGDRNCKACGKPTGCRFADTCRRCVDAEDRDAR